MPTLPLVTGVTETAQTEPPATRLSDLLAGRLPQPTRDRLSRTITDLEGIFEAEKDEKTKARVGAALGMLRGTRKPKGDEPPPQSRANSARFGGRSHG